MGIELYISTSPASPLVSLCRLASGNSTCRFDGEKDLTGWDYVFSAIDSLVVFAPLKSMFSMLKSLPAIGGKAFAVSKAEVAGVEMLMAIEAMGLQKAQSKQLMTSAKAVGLAGEEDLKLLAAELKATSAGAAGAFDSAGRMARPKSRSVLFQGYDTVTCGPTSCSMVINTLTGKKVEVETLVSRTVLLESGTTGDQLVFLLKSENVSARWSRSTFSKDLETLTANGRPVIVMVNTPRGKHWLIVDGVTTRLRKKVVAIRDPGTVDGSYFELWDSFTSRFLKEAVIPNQ